MEMEYCFNGGWIGEGKLLLVLSKTERSLQLLCASAIPW